MNALSCACTSACVFTSETYCGTYWNLSEPKWTTFLRCVVSAMRWTRPGWIFITTAFANDALVNTAVCTDIISSLAKSNPCFFVLLWWSLAFRSNKNSDLPTYLIRGAIRCTEAHMFGLQLTMLYCANELWLLDLFSVQGVLRLLIIVMCVTQITVLWTYLTRKPVNSVGAYFNGIFNWIWGTSTRFPLVQEKHQTKRWDWRLIVKPQFQIIHQLCVCNGYMDPHEIGIFWVSRDGDSWMSSTAVALIFVNRTEVSQF